MRSSEQVRELVAKGHWTDSQAQTALLLDIRYLLMQQIERLDKIDGQTRKPGRPRKKRKSGTQPAG